MTAMGSPEGRPAIVRGGGLRLVRGSHAEISGRLGREPRSDVRSIGLLQADRDFAGALPATDHATAAGIQLPRLELEAGSWAGPPARPDSAPPAGMLLLDGLVSASVNLYGRPAIELYGPGDVIGLAEGAEGTLDAVVTWRVHQPTSLVDLDERFAIAATKWPALWHVVLRRCSTRANRLAAQLAALQLPRIEDRLEAVLWQLADRWGRVTTDGVVVPLTLTHETLGHLTAAKRPTVSVALAALAEQGAVSRRPDGTWLLVREPAALAATGF